MMAGRFLPPGEVLPACTICGEDVVVSADQGRPVHHRCAWYAARNDEGAPKGAHATIITTPPLAQGGGRRASG